MENLYFNDYQKASDYALILSNIDNNLLIRSTSSNTEIGQCACLSVEDQNFVPVYHIFYDESLYQLQDQFHRY